MIKTYLILLATCFSTSLSLAQPTSSEDESSKKKKWFSNHVGLAATVGIHQFDIEETQSTLNQIVPDRFNDPYLISYGISIMTPLIFGEEEPLLQKDITAWDTHLNIQVFGPFGRTEEDFKLAFTGVNFGYDIGKDLFPNTKWFDFIPAVGFSTGVMKVKHFDDAQNLETSVYTNPFFSPKALIEARFKIKELAIGFRAEYNYDVSKSFWKVKKGNNTLNLPDNRARGFVFTIVLGSLNEIEYEPSTLL